MTHNPDNLQTPKPTTEMLVRMQEVEDLNLGVWMTPWYSRNYPIDDNGGNDRVDWIRHGVKDVTDDTDRLEAFQSMLIVEWRGLPVESHFYGPFGVRAIVKFLGRDDADPACNFSVDEVRSLV